MKAPVLVSTLLIMTMTLTSFKQNSAPVQETRKASAEEQFALRVINAFQMNSPSDYAALFPSLEDFHALMDKNAVLYGANLNAAKEDFAKQYHSRAVPAVYEAFEDVTHQGKTAKINWNAVEFIRIELAEKPANSVSTVPFNIVFTSGGKQHRIQIERAMFVNGEWKTSQFVRLVE
jgi:hypothetical protein